jgi:hypothetical protein
MTMLSIRLISNITYIRDLYYKTLGIRNVYQMDIFNINLDSYNVGH